MPQVINYVSTTPTIRTLPIFQIMSSLLSATLHNYPTSTLKRTQLRHLHLEKKLFPKNIDQRRALQCAKASWQAGDGDFRTTKRVTRLNSAIQNRSFKELFELASDECKYFCNSLRSIKPFQFFKKVFESILSLMVRNNVVFVVKPTADNGVDVGIRWIIEWKDYNFPLGLGFDINTSLEYEGMVIIRKGNNIFDPLLCAKLLQLSLEEKLLPMMDKVLPKGVLEGKRRVTLMYCLFSLVVMVITHVLLKKTLH